MSRTGIVLTIDGLNARVQTARRGICEGCNHEADCCEPSSPGDEIVETINPIGAQPGQRVEFELPGHRELHLALLVWAVPLVGMLGGAIVGQAIAPAGHQEVVAVIGAVAGFVVGIVPAALVERSSRRRSCLPVVQRVLPGICPGPSLEPQ
jgi:sigma-E factor negative regulatory protein RseC